MIYVNTANVILTTEETRNDSHFTSQPRIPAKTLSCRMNKFRLLEHLMTGCEGQVVPQHLISGVSTFIKRASFTEDRESAYLKCSQYLSLVMESLPPQRNLTVVSSHYT